VPVVLITGCSSGFGFLSAETFARRGDTVYATMRNLAKADALRKLADEGLDIRLLELDVTEDDSVATAVKAVIDDSGRIDVLVNNAGLGWGGAVETMPDDQARMLFETNFWGVMRMTRAVLPTLRSQESGTIVNVSSTAGRVPMAFGGMYSASKHAVSALSELLSFEVEQFGIRVVSIEPGAFRTAIGENSEAVAHLDRKSPYYEKERSAVAFYATSVTDGPDPQIVADAIVEAAYAMDRQVHHLVGDDAKMFVEAYDSMNESDRHAMVKSILTPPAATP